MNIYKYTPVALLLLCLAAGCGGGAVSIADIPTFDLEAAIDNPQNFDITEISGGIEFIALDDSQKEGLIGRFPTIAESKNAWYVRDGVTNPVKKFDKAGKFLSTIGMIGRGPDELLRINSLAVDWEKDNLYLAESSSGPRDKRRIFAYDFSGRIFARNDSVATAKMSFFDDILVVLPWRYDLFPTSDDSKPGGKSTLLEIISPDMKKTGSVEAIKTGAPRIYTASGISAVFIDVLSNNGESLLVKMIRCDTVFCYKNEALEPAYVLDLGRYGMPDEVYGENATVSPDNFHNVLTLWESDRYLFVQTTNGSIVLDMSGTSEGFSPHGPDGKTGLFVGGIAVTLSYIRDNKLVGYMQAIDIVDNAAAITNPDLKALAATLKEDSNPVIVIAKIK